MASSPSSPTQATSGVQRRSFLAGTAGIATLLGLAGATPAHAKSTPTMTTGAVASRPRKTTAFQVRVDAARTQDRARAITHATNGDEARYAERFASFSKGLPHRDNGEVHLRAFNALVSACSTGEPADFEKIPLGGDRKLVNPQSGLAFALEGPDPAALKTAPAPAFASEEQAAEAAEVYWMALARDVPFAQYGKEPITKAAIKDLKKFKRFRNVSAKNLFRVPNRTSRGMEVGPYISQFLTLPIPFGATSVDQRFEVYVPGEDFMTTEQAWLDVQNGKSPKATPTKDSTKRYLRNGRDLGSFVHVDFSNQGSFQAAQILLAMGNAILDAGNPYLGYTTQSPNATFGGSDLLSAIQKVGNQGQRAAYYHKWPVHRRLRPEFFGGLLHKHLTGQAKYPIHESILNSPVLKAVHEKYGTYLLPMAYPEGSPTHPAYPSAHSTIIGAGVTVLKAYFDEDAVIENPMVASEDGLTLVPYKGEKLTVGGELNKLVYNISRGRDIAGVHWMSDDVVGNRLGEALAINWLREQRKLYNEDFEGYTLTTFDGKTITV